MAVPQPLAAFEGSLDSLGWRGVRPPLGTWTVLQDWRTYSARVRILLWNINSLGLAQRILLLGTMQVSRSN